VYSYVIKVLSGYGYYKFFLAKCKRHEIKNKKGWICVSYVRTIRDSNRAFESDLFNESVDLETVAVQPVFSLNVFGLSYPYFYGLTLYLIF